MRWAGVRSGPPHAPGSATKRPSSNGSKRLGPRQKKARKQGRSIVFIDESGLTEKPHRRRTWAPRGKTPVLFHNFNWKKLSMIAGLTLWDLHFELFTQNIKSEHVIVFLEKLKKVIPGKMLVVWDGLSAHRSRLVKEYLRSEPGRIEVLRLPAYAAELNPVEYIWAYLKQHELPKVCSKDFWSLGEVARARLKRMRRRKRILVAC